MAVEVMRETKNQQTFNTIIMQFQVRLDDYAIFYWLNLIDLPAFITLLNIHLDDVELYTIKVGDKIFYNQTELIKHLEKGSGFIHIKVLSPDKYLYLSKGYIFYEIRPDGSTNRNEMVALNCW